jgi:hypothetical protein
MGNDGQGMLRNEPLVTVYRKPSDAAMKDASSGAKQVEEPVVMKGWGTGQNS